MKTLHRMILLLVAFTLSFIAIEYAGLFSGQRAPFRGLLMFWPVLVLLLLIMILLIVSAVVNRRSMRGLKWLGLASVILMVGGIWTSRFTDFGIDVVLTEGQVYMTQGHRSEGLLYAGLYAPVPKFRLELSKVKTDGDLPQLGKENLKAECLFSLPEAADPRPFTVSEGLPQMKKGMFLRVKRFGYSPRYALAKEGRVLDSAFVALRLYPFGSEDYFRLLSPHTYSLQYHPGRLEGGVERPLKVRVTRNKDIIHNGYVGLKESIEVEDTSLSFEDMRRWVQLSITREWGMLMAAAGAVLAGICAVLWLITSLQRKH